MKLKLAKPRSVVVRILLSLLLLGIAPLASAQILSVPVTFTVKNVNNTETPCPVDQKSYEIKGHLVGPAALLTGSQKVPVTMYEHGIGWGEFYWHFTANPDYDYASRMADQGHVSLVYDQLGYGASGKPVGLLDCYGGEANIAHQIANAMRTGFYTATGSPIVRASKVAIASNQAAALVAEPAAYTYRDFDALIVTSFSDFPASFKPQFALQSAPVFAACALGGQRADGATGPYFYKNFPITDAAFSSLNFANADPAVVAQALALRGPAACGEPFSAIPTIGITNLQILLRKITVPVLVVNGLEDGFFTQPLGGKGQALYYKGSTDVTVETIANAGQALTLERTAADFRQVMHTWLTARGF